MMKKILGKFLTKRRRKLSRLNLLQAVDKTLNEFDRKPNLAPL